MSATEGQESYDDNETKETFRVIISFAAFAVACGVLLLATGMMHDDAAVTGIDTREMTFGALLLIPAGLAVLFFGALRGRPWAINTLRKYEELQEYDNRDRSEE